MLDGSELVDDDAEDDDSIWLEGTDCDETVWAQAKQVNAPVNTAANNVFMQSITPAHVDFNAAIGCRQSPQGSHEAPKK